jgi:co-chaperonin GroES (HSP10)
MKIKGYRILVEPDPVETMFGNIIIVMDERMEKAAQQFGTVLSIGPTCWTDRNGEKLGDWCEEGDRVLFSKHAGRFYVDPADPDKKELMIINDNDIIGVCNV